jgi:hypothetical protein
MDFGLSRGLLGGIHERDGHPISIAGLANALVELLLKVGLSVLRLG